MYYNIYVEYCVGGFKVKAKQEKVKSKKTIVKIIIICLAVVLVGYCSFALISNFASIGVLKSQKDELNDKYTQQVTENEKIKDILDSDDKDEYIEQKAREKGYVKDGEVVYYDISSSK